MSLSIRTMAAPRPHTPAHPATRISRAVTLLPTGPSQPRRRPTQGIRASAATPTRTRTRSVTTRGWEAEDACQLSRTAQAAAAATAPIPSQYTTLRMISASFAASHSPPASQPTRGQPAGTRSASACTASAHSCRPGGSNRAASRSILVSTQVSRSTRRGSARYEWLESNSSVKRGHMDDRPTDDRERPSGELLRLLVLQAECRKRDGAMLSGIEKERCVHHATVQQLAERQQQ